MIYLKYRIYLIHSDKGIIMVKNLEENKFEILYSDNLITVKKINNNEFVLWDKNSRVTRFFYYENKFNSQLLNQDSDNVVNDVSNFKGAYYLSTNNGIIKISEDLNNIISVYDKNEKILSVVENDFFRVLMTIDNILIYEEEEVILNFNVQEF